MKLVEFIMLGIIWCGKFDDTYLCISNKKSLLQTEYPKKYVKIVWLTQYSNINIIYKISKIPGLIKYPFKKYIFYATNT